MSSHMVQVDHVLNTNRNQNAHDPGIDPKWIHAFQGSKHVLVLSKCNFLEIPFYETIRMAERCAERSVVQRATQKKTVCSLKSIPNRVSDETNRL